MCEVTLYTLELAQSAHQCTIFYSFNFILGIFPAFPRIVINIFSIYRGLNLCQTLTEALFMHPII